MEVIQLAICPICEGSGICPECKGTGHSITGDMGRAIFGGDEKTCNRCDEDFNCYNCNGTGEVEDEDD